VVGGGGGRGGGVKGEEIIIVGRSELVAGYVADEGSEGYVFDLSKDDDECSTCSMTTCSTSTASSGHLTNVDRGAGL
jgi:hypothetical protein